MAGYTLIAVRGVLAEHDDGENPAAARVVSSGRILYHSLKQVSKLLVVVDQPEADRVAWWLKAHGFRDHVGVLVNPRPDAPVEGRSQVVADARQKGPLDLAVEGSAELAARTLHSGVVTLLVSVPEYTLSEFKPGADASGRPWSELLDELDTQAEMKASDTRFTADIAGARYDED